MVKIHPKIVIVSYNKLTFFKRENTNVFGVSVSILPQTFTQNGEKSPDFVTREDAQWQKVLAVTDSTEHVIIFIGKKSSGSLEIIHRAVEDFGDSRSKLYFVSCYHDSADKNTALDRYDIHSSRRYEFKEGTFPCDESIALEGLMRKFAREIGAK